MTGATGSIRLVRREGIDRELDILDRDPISMRTYLSLAVESLNKKRDVVLALVIPAESAKDVSYEDDISVEITKRGVVYLAECINMHRFTVSYSNPNIICVSKKNVTDPTMKCHIKNIYYYALTCSSLSVEIGCKNKDMFNTLSRVLDDSPEAVDEFARENPLILSSEWIGTENDYLNNSVFHVYVEQNKILGPVFDAKKASEEEGRKQQILFRIVIYVFLSCVCFSFIIHVLIKGISIYMLLRHVFLFSLCIVLLVLNTCM